MSEKESKPEERKKSAPWGERDVKIKEEFAKSTDKKIGRVTRSAKISMAAMYLSVL